MTTDTYPNNLLSDIEGAEWGYPFPADFNRSLEYVLAGLSERERLFIRQRYKDGMTYEEIGREAGITRERVRQVIANAVRKLTRPDRKGILIYGVSGMISRAARTRDEAASRKSLFPLDIPLEALPLSLRSYNCLKRAGKCTLRDVSEMTFDELCRVRNLGKKSIDEICATLTKYGLSLKTGGDRDEC